MGAWKLEDVDRGYTYTIANSGSSTKDYDYPNAGEPMAFQVFNPSMINLKSKLWTPYLGNQMAVCFDSGNEVNNNDWLISPEVVGGTKVTFMAKSVTAQYGMEKMKFLYSTSDRETASFRQVDDVIAVPADKWARFFKKNNILVGVSIDGPEDVHDAYRHTVQQRGTHSQVMRGIRTLMRHGVEWNAAGGEVPALPTCR